MAFEEHPMQALAAFLPDGTFDDVVAFLHHYKVHLTVTKRRKTVLGDYRHAFRGENHRISVNSNLNKYEFLITLLHELAHLLTYEQYGNRVEAHGKEWKGNYGLLLRKFIEKKIFPADIENALQRSVINPAATANGEVALILVLRRYDNQRREGYYHVAELPPGSFFQTDDKKIFRKGEKRRSRYTCTEIKTGLNYSFSPVYEVRLIEYPIS
jgi:SprT protein